MTQPVADGHQCTYGASQLSQHQLLVPIVQFAECPRCDRRRRPIERLKARGDLVAGGARHILAERPRRGEELRAAWRGLSARGEHDVVFRLLPPLQDLAASGQKHGPHPKRVRPLHDGEP